MSCAVPVPFTLIVGMVHIIAFSHQISIRFRLSAHREKLFLQDVLPAFFLPKSKIPAPVPPGCTKVIRAAISDLTVRILFDPGRDKRGKPLKRLEVFRHHLSDRPTLSFICISEQNRKSIGQQMDMVMADSAAVYPINESLFLLIPESDRKRSDHCFCKPLLQCKIMLPHFLIPGSFFQGSHPSCRISRQRRRHALSSILDDLVFIIHIRPQSSQMIHALFHRPECFLQPLFILLPETPIPGRLQIQASFFHNLDIAGHKEHDCVGPAIHAVSPDMIFSCAIRLQCTRIPIELLGIFLHQFQLQLQHPAH